MVACGEYLLVELGFEYVGFCGERKTGFSLTVLTIVLPSILGARVKGILNLPTKAHRYRALFSVGFTCANNSPQMSSPFLKKNYKLPLEYDCPPL